MAHKKNIVSISVIYHLVLVAIAFISERFHALDAAAGPDRDSTRGPRDPLSAVDREVDASEPKPAIASPALASASSASTASAGVGSGRLDFGVSANEQDGRSLVGVDPFTGEFIYTDAGVEEQEEATPPRASDVSSLVNAAKKRVDVTRRKYANMPELAEEGVSAKSSQNHGRLGSRHNRRNNGDSENGNVGGGFVEQSRARRDKKREERRLKDEL